MAQTPQSSKKTRTVRTSSRSGLQNSVLGTRNLMTVAAIAVVSLIIIIPLTYAETASVGTYKAAVVGSAFMGLWSLVFLLPLVVVRRGGAAIIAGLIIGIVSAIATPAGPAGIVGSLLGGVFVEIPFAVTLYRRWNNTMFLISGGVFGLLNAIVYITALKIAVGIGSNLLIVILCVVSGIVGAVLAIAIGRALARAGVGVNRDR